MYPRDQLVHAVMHLLLDSIIILKITYVYNFSYRYRSLNDEKKIRPSFLAFR